MFLKLFILSLVCFIPFVTPYQPAASAWRLNVVAPAQVAGVVSLIPSFDLGQLIGKITNGTLALLNSADDQTGCHPITTNQTNGGIPYSQVVIMTLPGRCSQTAKVHNIYDVDPIGWIVPFNNNIGQINSQFSGNAPIFGVPATFWYYSMGYDDAMIILNYLLANMTTNTVTFNLVGSGPIFPSERIAFLNLTTALVAGGYHGDCNIMQCGNLIPIEVYVKDMPNIDPCIDRVEGIACIMDSFGFGHVGTLVFQYFVNSDYFDWRLINQFPALNGLIVFGSPMFRGAIPNTFCTQPTFLGLITLSNNSITSLPDCFLGLTYLIYFDMNNNLLTSVPPSLTQKTYMQVLVLNNNRLTSFSLNNFFWLPQLASLDVSNNQINSVLPNFQGFTNLASLKIQNNFFYNTGSIEHYFDNTPLLQLIDLTNNKLHGLLPQFVGASPILGHIHLGLNQFYGDMPSTWTAFVGIKQLSLFGNQLNGTIVPVAKMTSIEYLDISYNNLSFVTGVAEIDFSRDLNQYFGYFIPDSLMTLHADYNAYAPARWTERFNPKWPWFSGNLATITLNGNGINNFPRTLCNGFTTTIRLANNNLQGAFPPCPFAGDMQLIDVHDNPDFFGGSYPPFVSRGSKYSVSSNQEYFCPDLIIPGNDRFQMIIDPSYYSYEGCICNNGLYGTPPHCQLIPDSVLVTNSSTLTAARLNASIEIEELLQRQVNLMTVNITDATYGDRKYMKGMSSTFHTTLANLLGPLPDVDAEKVIVLIFYINLDTFTDATDVLELFDGNVDDSANGVFSIQGNSAVNVLDSFPGNLNNTKYYNDSLTFAVSVVNHQAILQYQTSKSAANQFTLEYYTAADCPVNYYLPSSNSTFCRPIPECKSDDFDYTISACQGDSRTVSYFVASGVVCRVTPQHPIPATQTIPCSSLLFNNNVAVILLVLAIALLLIGAVPYLYYLYNKISHSRGAEKAKLKINAMWSLALMGSWALNFVTIIVNVGSVDSIRCNIRVIGIVSSFFAAIAAASVAQQAVVNEIRTERQVKINKVNHQLRYGSFLIGGISIELIILIVTSAATFSSFVETVPNDYNGTLVDTSVCTLGSIPFLPIALLGINALIALWSFISMTPTWSEVLVDLDEKVNEIKSVNFVKIRDSQKLQMVSATLIQFVTIITTVLIVLFSYTNIVGIKNDNVTVSMMQIGLFLSNVGVTIFLYYLPNLVKYFPCRKSSTTKSLVPAASHYRAMVNYFSDVEAQPFQPCTPIQGVQDAHYILDWKDVQPIPGVVSVIVVDNCKSVIVDCASIPLRVQDPIMLAPIGGTNQTQGLVHISNCNAVLLKNVNIVDGCKVQLSLFNCRNVYLEDFHLFHWVSSALSIVQCKDVHFVGHNNKVDRPISASMAPWIYTYLYYLNEIRASGALGANQSAQAYIDAIQKGTPLGAFAPSWVSSPSSMSIVQCRDSQRINFNLNIAGADLIGESTKRCERIVQNDWKEIAMCNFTKDDIYDAQQQFAPNFWVKIHAFVVLNCFTLDSGTTKILTAIVNQDSFTFQRLTAAVANESTIALTGFKLTNCKNCTFGSATEIHNLSSDNGQVCGILSEHSSNIRVNDVTVANFYAANAEGAWAFVDTDQPLLSVPVAPRSTKSFSIQ